MTSRRARLIAASLALGALAPAQAMADCLATSAGVDAVTIVCTDGTTVISPFATSFSGSDGSGADAITITGGQISDIAGIGTPLVDSDFPLDGSADIETLDGADVVLISGGVIGDAAAPVNVNLGDGANQLTMSGGTLFGSIFGGVDDDDIQVSGAAVIIGNVNANAIEAGDGNDQVTIIGGTLGTISDPAGVDLGAGADTFAMSGGTINGSVFGLGGGNLFNISGGTILGSVFAGSQNDTVNISGTADIRFDPTVGTDSVGLEDGNDTFTISGGTLSGDVSGGTGSDFFLIVGGTIQGDVSGNSGANSYTVSGGVVGGSINGGDDGDTYNIMGGSIGGTVWGGQGNDTVTVSGNAQIGFDPDFYTATDGDSITLLGGDDVFTMTGGTLLAGVSGNAGNDQIFISGGSVGLYVSGQQDDDLIVISGGSIGTYVQGGAGNDTLEISGGTVGTDVMGGDGDDVIAVSGGTIGGNVTGDSGNDSVSVSGGQIGGNIEAETVTLTGGTIGGDILGISGDTLIINDSLSTAALNLRNGVLFSGTGANGFISNTDLARGGGFTQVFSGFSTVTSDNATLGFGSGAVGIASLIMQNGSILYVRGAADMGSGTASFSNSSLQMTNGIAGDVLTLGGIVLNNSSIGLDVDQSALTADQIIAGSFTLLGSNTINVNLLGTPQFSQPTDIVIFTAGAPIDGTFDVQGLPGTSGSLFIYQLLTMPDGSLVLRATPTNVELAVETQNAADVAALSTVLDTFLELNDDAIALALGLSGGASGAQLTETINVFASGQLGRIHHDGFDVSTPILSGVGPNFTVDEFSAALSIDFNAAKAFDMDSRYGLNLGIFGGYASADVDVGAYQSFTSVGNSENRSGMFGSYGLFRQGYNYLLLSGVAFFGNTDVVNDILGTTGDYATEGYGINASAGHIFVLGDRMRFDLRGGLLGVTFSGGDYTDSGGTYFGSSRISFGAFKFEPGIYADYQLDNGMIISPYARADFQQRFGYSNTATIDGVRVEFDDADFSAALSGGFNLKMTERSTLSSEIKGKWSTDSSSIAGKLGLKVAF